MYYDFIAGGKEYKLRLNTRGTVALEKQLGCNPLGIFGTGDTIPTVTVMVTILHASLQQFHHGISLDDAYGIFDAWLEDNHTMTDFIAVIIELYKVSGLIKTEEDPVAEKN
jgi:hypothetical protein